MEPKKNKKYDLESKNTLFFSIGLVTALLCVTVAFEWRGQYDGLDLTPKDPVFEEVYLVPQTQFPLPKAPEIPQKPLQKSVEAVNFVSTAEASQLIENLIEPSDPVDFSSLPIGDPLPPEEPPFFEGVIETMPEFPGGIDQFYSYIAKNLHYPSKAQRMDVQGRVYVQFIIDTDGKLIDVKAIKGIGSGCDEEAIRVIMNSPK